jgi:hypothetical protein
LDSARPSRYSLSGYLWTSGYLRPSLQPLQGVVRPCRETIALSKVKEQLQAAAAEVENVVLAGNINLDTTRRCNVRYGRRCIMLAHDSAVADSNMRYLETGITYRSHGIGRPL